MLLKRGILGDIMGLVEKIAEENFASSNPKYLVQAVYEKITDENMFDFFTSDNLLVRRAVAKRVYESLNDPEFVKRIIEGLKQDDRAEGILTALSHSNLNKNPVILMQVKRNLSSDNDKIKNAAATVISYQYPEHAACLIPQLKDSSANDIAKLACHSENTEITWDILNFYDFPRKKSLPPYIGLLLRPVWLGANYQINPEAISILIDMFGYSNFEVNENTLESLKKGFMFVSKEMSESLQPNKWFERIQNFLWALLPDSLNMEKKHVAVNLDDKIDVALFLAAVRESDVTNLQAKKERDPFSYRKEGIDVVFSHSPYRYFKRKIIDDGIKLAEELNVKKIGEFLVDYTRVLLETNNEAHVEADVLLRSKWLALPRTADYSPNPIRFPITKERDYPLAKFAVINDFKLPAPDARLSVGANSIVNVAAYFGINGVADKLAELEELYSKFLLPIGIELQIPKSVRNTSLAWKQALRYFNIPSPRRPEYFDMIETAFRPARTFHSMTLGIMLMYKLGLMKYEQDMAYHISVEGELGDDVKYIAFPEMFINRSRSKIENKEMRFYRMARLMSKGFININHDVEPCYGKEKPKARTEVRVFCCQTDKEEDGVKLRLTCIDDLISAHLLSSALASDLPEFRGAWDSYKKDIIDYMQKLPEEFSKFLNANWYEATGDPRDGNLVGMLPIIKKREVVSSIVKEREIGGTLENDFKEIIGRHAKQIHDLFLKQFDINYDFSLFQKCNYDIPYFVPEELLDSISEKYFG